MKSIISRNGVHIGTVPDNWSVNKTLRCLEMPITDGPHETPIAVDGENGIPFVSAEAVSCGNGSIDFNHIWGYISKEYYNECCKKYIPQTNDIYMIKSGATTGKVAIVDTDKVFTIWSPLAVFRADKHILTPRYLYYFLQSPVYLSQVELGWNYGTQQNIGMRVLEQLYICYPSLAEQKTIVSYLDSKCAAIDKAIEKHKKIIEKLEEYKASYVTHILTKGLGNVGGYISSGIQQIGDIPSHWKVLRIKHLLSDDAVNLRVGPFGSALSTKEYTDEGPWVYTQRTVLDDNFENNIVHISENKYNSLEGFAVYAGDLLVTTRGSIGKLAITPKSAPKGILHPCLIKFRVDQSRIHHRILKYIFNDTNLIMNQIRKKAEGATIEALYSGPLKDVYLPLAPYAEQIQILDLLDTQTHKIQNGIKSHESVIEKLEEYKKSIIYNAVTGKIDCREA